MTSFTFNSWFQDPIEIPRPALTVRMVIFKTEWEVGEGLYSNDEIIKQTRNIFIESEEGKWLADNNIAVNVSIANDFGYKIKRIVFFSDVTPMQQTEYLLRFFK